jgi:hypothetical protein
MVAMRRERPLLQESQHGGMYRFIGFGEYVSLALLAVCSCHLAGRIDGDFEFLPAPVGLDIQDRLDEIAGCNGFV